MLDREWEATKELIMHAHDDVRRLQERGQLILGAGLAAAGLSIPIILSAPDLGLPLSEALFAFAFAWYFNLNAEVAATAEIRDYLSTMLNGATETHPFKYPVLGDVGRSHPSAGAAGLLPMGILVGFAVVGGVNAFAQPDWRGDEYHLPHVAAVALYVITTALAAFGLIMAGKAGSEYREDARSRLEYGVSPPRRPTWIVRIFRQLLRRDDQGWRREPPGDASLNS